MQVVHSLDELRPDRPAVLTIGNFDGVHRGHQALIGAVVQRAQATDTCSVVITFDPHTNRVIHPDRELQLLTTIEDRIRLIGTLGVDQLVVLPFDQPTAALTAEEFMAHIGQHVRLAELWDGPDFRLGHRGAGTMQVLAEIGRSQGFEVHAVEVLGGQMGRVSSSTIRGLLQQGDVAQAAELLGRPYELSGTVIHGDGRGRTIGIPTANLQTAAELVRPANGVYACFVLLEGGERHRAVTNIGVRPTFGQLTPSVEAHLLDADRDLYGKQIGVKFIERLRDEQRFNGIDALLEQIGRDIAKARDLLDTHR